MELTSIVLLCLVLGINVLCFNLGMIIGRHYAYEHIKPYDLAEGADTRRAKLSHNKPGS